MLVDMLTLKLAMFILGVGLALFVTYRLQWLQRYVAWWDEAARQTDSTNGTVSAKRAVYIHGAGLGFWLVAHVLHHNNWVFTKESLSAFETLLYCTVGGYVGGRVAEAITAKIQAGAAKAQAPEGDAQ